MGFTTIENFRHYTGIQEKDLEDNDIMMILDEADKFTVNQIIVKIFDEELEGTINGSNMEFTTKFKPIADITRDKTINSEDVTVHGKYYTDDENNEYSHELTVSTVNSRDGIITLSSAPTDDDNSSTGAEIGLFCDYAYWKLIEEPDWDRVAQASCYYAGYLATQRFDFGLVGPDFLNLFKRTIKSIKQTQGFVHGKKKAAFDIKFVSD